MKKTAGIVAALLLTVIAHSQEYWFDDLPWLSSREEVTAIMTEKGYVFEIDEKTERNITGYTGRIADEDAHVVAVYSPEGLVRMIVVLLVEGSVIRKFRDVRDILTEEYGEPDYGGEIFTLPYKDGDGYEEQAIRLGKASFFSAWEGKEGSILGIHVTKGLKIQIIFDSPYGAAEYERLKKESVSRSP